ncbi:NUDIX domain-containing protein [Deinococcus radiophilus]|uniref:NUDIX domain-containing protein n=1 Tax=Deinococcus radiophilus TaxID=32062 RepID=A0A3S0I8N1_9DEIO|nr:NUDIX domain-containing protein [Deinococcus radiophilus]RTR27752.1 NUDIX domain-containing protein [Deinococcus radiophilus]UFA50072.1 NUDIX domain-containing protein [Deinococcus radiophilus]
MPTSAPPDYITDLRTIIGNAPVNLMGAAGLMFDAEGRVLLQRLVGRDDVWSLPGGLCELAEPPERTLRREVQEETGLTVLDAELLTLHTTPLRTLGNGHQASFYTALYRVTAWEGVPQADGVEVAELRWFSVEALPPMRGYIGRWAAEWLREQ